jgi:hypothetical protein
MIKAAEKSAMWLTLVEEYAIRAREFADAVAHLGRLADHHHTCISPEFIQQWQEVGKKRELCDSAYDTLSAYIEDHSGPNIAHSPTGDSSLNSGYEKEQAKARAEVVLR